jgi:chromosome segregation ATPase
VEEVQGELEEAQAMVESLLEEHAAMEGEIVAAHGERQAAEARLEGLGKEKQRLQQQLNMTIIGMTDAENQVRPGSRLIVGFRV